VRGLGCIDLALEGVRVEREQLLGAVDRGFQVATWALQGGRVAIAAQALGVGQAALDEALRHAKARHTFGRPIARYQAIQWMLADMATELAAARVLMLKAADTKDRSEDCGLEAAMAKLLASEAAHRAADKAMQILASAGYRRGSTVERLFRDARATRDLPGHVGGAADGHRFEDSRARVSRLFPAELTRRRPIVPSLATPGAAWLSSEAAGSKFLRISVLPSRP
jgi:butyryl-CoA dehydrogenase